MINRVYSTVGNLNFNFTEDIKEEILMFCWYIPSCNLLMLSRPRVMCAYKVMKWQYLSPVLYWPIKTNVDIKNECIFVNVADY